MDFHILRQQGLSIRKIAALRGVSRNTVRRALRSTSPPSGKRRREGGAKLAPYVDQITAWLRDPVTTLWSAERIFDELGDRGYDGGRTVLKEHVRRHRPRPKPLAEARFFVKPGQQMQVDWGEMGIVSVGGVPRKVYAFVAVLAWSRAMFVRFTTDMQLLTWLDCHYRAFTFFGGVPAETLIDNLKTGVLSRAGGTVHWHPSYEELAVNVGFRPLAHFPMRPKTKGRVERMVPFVRGRFFIGRDIVDLVSLNAQAEQWLRERANQRIHPITRERPCDRFAIEREALKPLRDYDIMLEESRVADAYALVNVDGVRYSVPAIFARQPLTLQRRIDGLRLLKDGETLASHDYAPPGQRLVQIPEHLPPRPQPRHERFAALGEAVVERFGEGGRRYVAAVEAKAPHAPLALLREVLERDAEFHHDVVAGAIESLLAFDVVKRGVLSTLCHRFGGTPRITAEPAASVLPHIEVEQRSLAVYDEFAA